MPQPTERKVKIRERNLPMGVYSKTVSDCVVTWLEATHTWRRLPIDAQRQPGLLVEAAPLRTVSANRRTQGVEVLSQSRLCLFSGTPRIIAETHRWAGMSCWSIFHRFSQNKPPPITLSHSICQLSEIGKVPTSAIQAARRPSRSKG